MGKMDTKVGLPSLPQILPRGIKDAVSRFLSIEGLETSEMHVRDMKPFEVSFHPSTSIF